MNIILRHTSFKRIRPLSNLSLKCGASKPRARFLKDLLSFFSLLRPELRTQGFRIRHWRRNSPDGLSRRSNNLTNLSFRQQRPLAVGNWKWPSRLIYSTFNFQLFFSLIFQRLFPRWMFGSLEFSFPACSIFFLSCYFILLAPTKVAALMSIFFNLKHLLIIQF